MMNEMISKYLGEEQTGAWEALMRAERLPDSLDARLAECLGHAKSGLEKKLIDVIEGRITENVMSIVLDLMSVLLVLDKGYRRNINGFEAVYVFTDQQGDFYVAAQFHNGRLSVHNKKVKEPTFTLRFRDNEALIKMFFSGAPDILNAMLNQQVDFEGNVNYINKFAYMALHILLTITGGQGFADA